MDDLFRELNQGEPVDLQDMLDARERRAERQRALLQRKSGTLLCFTLNIPGPRKVFPLTEQAFREGCGVIAGLLAARRIQTVHRESHESKTGAELFTLVDLPPAALKTMMMHIEDQHPLGRLFDIDVFEADGIPLSGVASGRLVRRCLVCDGPVWECARSRAHPVEALALRTVEIMHRHFLSSHADRVSGLAVRALLYEVGCTPKPGLVDRSNNGSHRDMDMFTFFASASALGPYFRDMAMLGAEYGGELSALLALLRFPGQLAERTMFAATGGINVHKGAIFSLGLLCAAAGLAWSGRIEAGADGLLEACAAIAKKIPGELEGCGGATLTHGESAYRRYGITGARGEAAAGYPCVRLYGLPVLTACRAEKASWNDAGVVAFLHLLARAEDSNLVTRSDYSALRTLQESLLGELSRERDTGSLLAYARELDGEFVGRNISPGGTADLLAMCYFLAFYLERGHD